MSAEMITPATLRDWPLPSGGSSKHSRGHILIAGGARTSPGAAMLSGLAALRVGAGVLQMVVPDDLALPIAIAIPEAGVRPLSGDLAEIGESADAVVVGPGFDDPDTTEDVLRRLLPGLADDVPVLLDAFALGVLPNLRELAEPLRGRAVLTPNSREAARLLGVDDVDDRDEDEVAQAIADDYGCVVSYQDFVATAGGPLRQITTGHSGLGTSGSGDVLAGSIGGLLARGATPEQAASWGTHLHASAGDRLAARIGRLGFLARELADELPLVLTELLS